MTDTHETIKKVWDEHQDNDWREDQSHWRGKGRWADDTKWQSIGRGTVQKLRGLWRYLGKESIPGPMNVLEWGPGGGSNLFGFRYLASTYHGVDISEKNLNECARMIGEEGFERIFSPILLTGEPETVAQSVEEPIDLFISTSVFQHFPSKEYGEKVLAAVKAISKPSALGIVQIRFDNGNPKFRPIEDIAQYEERHITATSYGIDEFWGLLKKHGFHPLLIGEVNPANNYATFYFRAS